ncbi:MAG: hypothetical protein R6U15_08330 [Candidatus Izemoplasmatales bacterium]
MANYNTITFIRRIVRSLLRDRLQTDGRMSYIYQGIAIFTLPDDFPDSSTITVYKNGTPLSSSDWTYNSTNNTVTISASLTTNDNILITYHYYDKYSDDELLDYIEASLPIFAKFGYDRLFTLNSARTEVVTYNGVNPTLAECYQICVVSAINIDPRNIDIKTKEFSLTAEEKKSKSDLFAEAFQKFTGSFLGEFEWLEILPEDE